MGLRMSTHCCGPRYVDCPDSFRTESDFVRHIGCPYASRACGCGMIRNMWSISMVDNTYTRAIRGKFSPSYFLFHFTIRDTEFGYCNYSPVADRISLGLIAASSGWMIKFLRKNFFVLNSTSWCNGCRFYDKRVLCILKLTRMHVRYKVSSHRSLCCSYTRFVVLIGFFTHNPFLERKIIVFIQLNCSWILTPHHLVMGGVWLHLN